MSKMVINKVWSHNLLEMLLHLSIFTLKSTVKHSIILRPFIKSQTEIKSSHSLLERIDSEHLTENFVKRFIVCRELYHKLLHGPLPVLIPADT